MTSAYGFIIRWIINTIALLVTVKVIPGIHVETWETTMVAALLLGLLNAFLKPMMILLMFPLFIVSLGFFTLIINAFLFYLVSKLVSGFYVVDFFSAFLGALFYSIISFFLSIFIDPERKMDVRFYRKYSSRRRDKKNDDVIDVEGRADEDSPNNRISRS